MNYVTLLILGHILGLAAFIIFKRIRKARQAKSGCEGCDVEGCSMHQIVGKKQK